MEASKTLVNTMAQSDNSTKLELYKLYVEMADKISSRRIAASSYFLTINTGIVVFSGYLSPSQGREIIFEQYWMVAFAGIILSFLWYRVIRSYKDLNRAKFGIIHQIEEDLPYRLFNAEWESVGRGKDPRKYLPFSNIEMGVPWVFIALYIIVLLKVIPWDALCAPL